MGFHKSVKLPFSATISGEALSFMTHITKQAKPKDLYKTISLSSQKTQQFTSLMIISLHIHKCNTMG